MIEVHTPFLDLTAIAGSGQCFRWQPLDGGYRIVAMRRAVAVRQPARDILRIECGRDEYQSIWKGYFDLDTDYRAIIDAVSPGDAYLTAAAAHGSGIRILRQEPWETLVTFIISQRKNIPAIRRAVEMLCAAAGDVIAEDAGGPVYAFPTPERLLSLTDGELAACSLGYRAPYVRAAAEAFCGGLRMDDFRAMDDPALLNALCALRGVGPKIAQCTMLFGFHRMNAFPVDVWMGRVSARHYPQGFPLEKYAPWAGVMQQYMFAYERFLEGKS